MDDSSNDTITPDVKFQLVRKIEAHKIMAVNGTGLLPHEEKFLEFHKPAGVILFDRNVESISQLGELIAAVKEKLSLNGLDPLVMVDHEGDFVSHLKNIIGIPPAPLALAAAGDAALAEKVAEETGTMIRRLGLNVVLAPCADCLFNISSPVTGLRTFGADPVKVREFVVATLRGFKKAGVIACVKHFPGHGSTLEDSHETLPVVEKAQDELKRSDVIPFAGAFEEGVDMCMVAHVAYRLGDQGEETMPASFDRRIIRDLLREEIGFDGVVITDALEMQGAVKHARTRFGGFAGGLERPLLAGADLLLYSWPVPERMSLNDDGESIMSVEIIETIIHTLERVVDRERLERKLEEAASNNEGVRKLLDILRVSQDRVLRLRTKVTGLAPPPRERERGKVIEIRDYPLVPSIYMEVAEKSIAVSDPSGAVPLDDGDVNLLLPILYRAGGMSACQDLEAFTGVILKNFPSWEREAVIIGFEDGGGGPPKLLFQKDNGMGGREEIPLAGKILPVVSFRGRPPDAFLMNLRHLIESSDCSMIVLTGWPILDWIPRGVSYMVTLGSSPQVASAAARILCGEIQAEGDLKRLGIAT